VHSHVLLVCNYATMMCCYFCLSMHDVLCLSKLWLKRGSSSKDACSVRDNAVTHVTPSGMLYLYVYVCSVEGEYSLL
jgi:hypothetical protein